MIARANLDGSNRTTLVTRDISNPLDLTIDMQTHNIYWADSREDAIFTVNFDGKNRQTIRDKLPSPKGLALLRENVFWVDRNLENIYKASKIPGQVAEPVIQDSKTKDCSPKKQCIQSRSRRRSEGKQEISKCRTFHPVSSGLSY